MQNLLENLNKEQTSAVKHTNGPLLIVAGAGTGKTTVITRRIAYLIDQKLALPDEILSLTFTDKAAGEMQERVDILLPLGYHDLWISTFHSFCQRILEQHGLDIGLPGDFKLVNNTAAWILIHDNLEKFNLDYYRPLGNPRKFISALLKHFSRCKDELIAPGDYLAYGESLRLQTDQPIKLKKKQETSNKGQEAVLPVDELEISRIEELANAFHVYQKLLLDNNFLDFGDLINYALELFNKRPTILKRYQEKFKFIMVDEFQDTNFAQYQLVKLLTGTGQNLAVVGDDDQSIYKFRGASVSNILKFKEDYPGFNQITLVENYRSSQNILDLAYNFIQANNPDRLEVKLKIDKQLKSNLAEVGKIEVIEGRDLSEELNLVAKKIIGIKNTSSASKGEGAAPISWNNFAVLVRSNAAAAELLPILAQAHIPHTYVANTGLYQKPLISFLIAYVSLLDNFHDSFALYRVLNFNGLKIPAQDLSTLLLSSQKKTLSLYETLLASKTLTGIAPATHTTIEKVLAQLNNHAKLAQEKSANEAFVQIANELNLEKNLQEETAENSENRELLEQFYKKIESFVQENTDKSLHKFLSLLNLEVESGDDGQIKFDPNQGPESLKVLTIHSAKGLEFKYVFIPNMVELRFPTRARSDGIDIPTALVKDILPEGDFHLQEERRLFYVALTRAKTNLYLSWSKDYGGAKTKKPSLFLQETKLVPGAITSQATGKVIFYSNSARPAVYKLLPEKFSFSALKAFENCPLQYKYQYYLKLPSPGSAYFSFGQTMHKVFELFLKDFRTRKNQSQGDLFAKTAERATLGNYKFLEQLYQKNWVDEWYENAKQKEDYRKKGAELLKKFYDYSLNNAPNPKYLEQSFYLPLGKYKFTGKIDRADQADGGLHIIDYKTSEKIPAKNGKSELDQLLVYQWAAQEGLGEKVTKLCYWYLQDNKFLREDIASETEIEQLKKRLLENIEKIIYITEHNLFKEEDQKLNHHDCKFSYLE